MLRGRRFNDKQLQVSARCVNFFFALSDIFDSIWFDFVFQMSWFVQNAEPPKIASEDELLDDVVADDSLVSEIRLEDEEEDEETEEDRSWRR